VKQVKKKNRPKGRPLQQQKQKAAAKLSLPQSARRRRGPLQRQNSAASAKVDREMLVSSC
jgi:hypothetical protein